MLSILRLIPLIAFFGGYWLTRDVVTATLFLISLIPVQCALEYLLMRKLSRETAISSVAVVTLGGLTILLKDPIYIMWKPTVIAWGIALAVMATAVIPTGQRWLEALLAKGGLQECQTSWCQRVWALGFGLIGVTNLWVFTYLSSDAWVLFKLAGLPACYFVVLLSGLTLAWASSSQEGKSDDDSESGLEASSPATD